MRVYLQLGCDGLYERILVGEEKIAPKKRKKRRSLQVTGRGER
jgi:hypothetical protein